MRVTIVDQTQKLCDQNCFNVFMIVGLQVSFTANNEYFLRTFLNKTKSSGFGSEIMLTPGQAGPIRETETKG
jgi:hypothetical protein